MLIQDIVILELDVVQLPILLNTRYSFWSFFDVSSDKTGNRKTRIDKPNRTPFSLVYLNTLELCILWIRIFQEKGPFRRIHSCSAQHVRPILTFGPFQTCSDHLCLLRSMSTSAHVNFDSCQLRPISTSAHINFGPYLLRPRYTKISDLRGRHDSWIVWHKLKTQFICTSLFKKYFFCV